MIDFRIRILVLDDDFAYRQILCGMLHRLGFSNILEDDGTRALALLREHAFGLVLSEMVMAPHSGLELLCAARQVPRLARLPFIITTDIADSSWVRTAREAGVDAYLLKPFDIDHLRRVVLGTLAREQPLAPAAGETRWRA